MTHTWLIHSLVQLAEDVKCTPLISGPGSFFAELHGTSNELFPAGHCASRQAGSLAAFTTLPYKHGL